MAKRRRRARKPEDALRSIKVPRLSIPGAAMGGFAEGAGAGLGGSTSGQGGGARRRHTGASGGVGTVGGGGSGTVAPAPVPGAVSPPPGVAVVGPTIKPIAPVPFKLKNPPKV